MVQQNCKYVNLAPGDFVYGVKGKQKYFTVLGSCISLVLWHPKTQFYAMCHYINPHTPPGESPCSLVKGRYADQVLPYLEKQLLKYVSDPTELELTLCGGASSAAANNLARHYQIARLNTEVAHEFIDKNQLRIKIEDTGGQLARRLRFDSKTGELEIVTVHSGASSYE
jgi:chemotaxis protein CheD